MTELLLITIVIALLLLMFVRWFPVSQAPHSRTRRHDYYRGREGEGYDDV